MRMLNIEILGGVGEYGRNCFYIEKEGRAILLDCGVMNNPQKTLPNLTEAHVAKLEAVFISHSHIDHVGAIPLLEKWGYNGPIIMSDMTAQQLKITFLNISIFHPKSIGGWIFVNKDVAYQWGYSGHLIGSVWYQIRFWGKMLFYSGDYVMDSYLLKATLPVADGTIYDVAFIDSGHVEKQINNFQTLQQIMEYISVYPEQPFIFPSSFSGKTVDIAAYLHQHTQRTLHIDQDLISLFEQYEKASENLLPTKAILPSFKQQCSTKSADLGDIYFVPERNASKLLELLQKIPKAIVIFTGYWQKDNYKMMLSKTEYKEFFYKTHPDYHDILTLSKKIHAQTTIYFHSSFTNRETTFLQLLKNKKALT